LAIGEGPPGEAIGCHVIAACRRLDPANARTGRGNTHYQGPQPTAFEIFSVLSR
jgi:hypothetical protein